MKTFHIFGAVALASSATAAVCPFSLLKRAGLLSADDEAKYDAVKADSTLADELFRAHHAQSARQEKRSATELIGPRSDDGILDLPLGGGLREYICCYALPVRMLTLRI